MDTEHIKPSTMSTFHVILYSPPHLLMSFIDRHILMLTIATYIELWQAQKNLIGINYSYRNYTAINGRSHVSATIRNCDNNMEKQWKKIIQQMTVMMLQ